MKKDDSKQEYRMKINSFSFFCLKRVCERDVNAEIYKTFKFAGKAATLDSITPPHEENFQVGVPVERRLF